MTDSVRVATGSGRRSTRATPRPLPAAPAGATEIPGSVWAALVDWQASHGRHLAIRQAKTPWEVLVAEVMSQQTQVARIGEPWRRFLESWPTPSAFAAASTRDVLRAWAGLGYNRRALALRDAAAAIVEHHQGSVPEDVVSLERLPGVGPYTARAVAATAFGLPVAPLDVNARRVMQRVLGDGRSGRAIQAAADRAIGSIDPAAWTFAVMDLAVLCCIRRAPRCDECPIAGSCASRGTAGEPRRDRSRTPSNATRFEGTRRWLRGRVIARLRDAEPAAWIGFDEPIGEHSGEAVRSVVETLVAEGVIELQGTLARLR